MSFVIVFSFYKERSCSMRKTIYNQISNRTLMTIEQQQHLRQDDYGYTIPGKNHHGTFAA